MYKSKPGHHRYNPSAGSDPTSSSKPPGRFSLVTGLLDEDEYKHDHALVYGDDSKFARQLKKLLRDEEEDRKLQKILDLSAYLDQQENVKFVLKLARPSLNLLLKVLAEQSGAEAKAYLTECIGKVGFVILADREPGRYFEWTMEKVGLAGCSHPRDTEVKVRLLAALQTNFRSDVHFRLVERVV